MATVASPAPLKEAFIRNSRTTEALPPSIHQVEQAPRPRDPDDRERHRGGQADRHRLHGRARRLLRLLLADPAGHDRGRGHAESHRHRVDDGQEGLGEADRGHRVGAEPGHEEHVREREDGLHHHLEGHGHREEEDGPVQAALGVVLGRAPEGLPDEPEDRFLALEIPGRRGASRRHLPGHVWCVVHRPAPEPDEPPARRQNKRPSGVCTLEGLMTATLSAGF
jgi:hypothetical protein